MKTKANCTSLPCTRTGAGLSVEGLRRDLYEGGYEMPEKLGALDSPEFIAAGSVRESGFGDSIHVSNWWRE